MPIYKYRCKKCKNTFNIIKKSDDKIPECPNCENGEVEKLIPNFSTRYRGSGFYETDYNDGGGVNEET